ncbi:Oxidoreductase FAD-binding domain protein OS=Tsukamurella paurometabola (strain ATCC 8368 / DSM/ CCUG 35730 / CIP 100753 / JCM 10117 / KCTC 9821 / NBRC 16120 / NCIMB 702349 / NCTC 13040) OX=521096 GN=Tpau_0360 PE=4 SV=1 [Tsukamurella paurometabola]|uniref:Oxidoreductase FAD-binding domain protein n=1 Tax=Tsukamurella paurometabola (strain ATCC 8368 / DSM 20162 / CCUG 35730 / CIP 100753 / JCM 10117 / KCTC 9821 / NBRC 16120 / NCIMB 702349 / NCTC 13040) TaxID=521096 RepID=D5URF0_TSUPD|nr:flavin reductase family protein [Tsukamurella paurometabola]ADG77003.1 Oxidoreductase FAD-binding domain protein [Tsukamurella paurometabola DSM 20162]SUP42409.1 Stearoyl-CoA 9-desaturase electron transfer partner [Tsukamurella paurometabola]
MSRFTRIAGNVIEAVLTPHAVDRYLELVDPMVTWTEIRGRVTAVSRRTDRSVTFTVTPTRQFTGFEAGQFIQVSVVIDGVRQTRCFSPAGSALWPGDLEFTVTADAGGQVSTHLRDNLRVGDVLGLSPAAGSFTLPGAPGDRPGRIRLISGGSGITPVLSILRTLVDEGYTGSVDLLHFCRDSADNPYRAELDLLARRSGVSVTYVYTRAGGRHLGAEHLPDFGDVGFACGPAALLETAKALYAEAGVELRVEEFAPPAAAAPSGDATGTLRFTEAGTEVDNDGRSILDQAESSGLFPESGCRMGICFSCTAVRTSGCTTNILTGETDSEPDQHIQLCISAPVGDVEIAL